MKEMRQEARLSICLLGPLQVMLDGNPLTGFESDKARALLVYLVVEADRPHRRETLAGLLWPESPERLARTNLRSALANLRRVIGDYATTPYLEVTRQTLQFDTASDAWIDAAAFSRLLKAGLSSQPPNRRMDQSAIQGLEDALALYRGSFLEGFSIPDCPGFEEWALLKREQLGRWALEALHRLAEGYETQGAFERALRHARRAVDLDPWREEAQRQLMRLLTLNGQRAAALAQYKACCRTLAEDLGVEPEAETTAVYEHIKSGEFLVSYPRPATLPNNLPTPLTPFVGRRRELGEVQDNLRDPACRLLTLVGPGGSGKTRLAIQAAREMAEGSFGRAAFPHGVFFVPLVSIDTFDALVPTIANALGFSFYDATRSRPEEQDAVGPIEQLLDYLRGKEALLVMDNFEQLLAAPLPTSPSSIGGDSASAPRTSEAIPAQSGWDYAVSGGRICAASRGLQEGTAGLVMDMLRAAPGLKLLITSREALNLQPEWRYPLAGMAVPPGVGAEEEEPSLLVKDYSALALFAECARRSCPSFSLDQEKDGVVRICQLVDGMPLAIELAAAWLTVLSPARIAAEIERGLDILTASVRDIEPRHRSMRAVFDHSWSLLSDEERVILQRLSVFRGGFGSSAAEAVAGASLPILAGLVGKSLLRVGSLGRYHMHELLRQYVLERLQADPLTEKEARDRHSAYYARCLNESGGALKGSGQQSALAQLDVEIDNARAAWDWAAEQGKVRWLDQAVEGMCLFYRWRLRAEEGEAECRFATGQLVRKGTAQASATAQREGERPLPDNVNGSVLSHSLSFGDASQSYAEGRRVLARILAWQAVFSAELGDPDRSSHLLGQSLTLLDGLASEGHEVRAERAFVLRHLGRRAFGSDWGEARRLYEHSLAIYRELGDTWESANTLDALGWLATYLGAYPEARARHEEALALRRTLGAPKTIAASLHGLGAMVGLQGEYEEAERLLRECIAIWRELDDRAGIERGLNQLGPGLLFFGRFAEGIPMLEEALEICDDLGLYARAIRANTFLGYGAMHLGDYEHARTKAVTALASAREVGAVDNIARSYWLLGDIALATEAYVEAVGSFQKSAAIYGEYGLPHEVAFVLADLTIAFCGLGQFAEARKCLLDAFLTAIAVRSILSFIPALPAAALLLGRLSKPQRAVEIYALAMCDPYVANSYWYSDVVGRYIDTVADTLPPDVVAAAQERGKARDLEATAEELLGELGGKVAG